MQHGLALSPCGFACIQKVPHPADPSAQLDQLGRRRLGPVAGIELSITRLAAAAGSVVFVDMMILLGVPTNGDSERFIPDRNGRSHSIRLPT
jgi:hypothetical protein